MFRNKTMNISNEKIIKTNYLKKINIKEVKDIEHFTTLQNICNYLGHTMTENKEIIAKASKNHFLYLKTWNEELVHSIETDDLSDKVKEKFKFIEENKINLEFREGRNLYNALLDYINIDITNSIILTMVLTGEDDINKVIESEDFKILIYLRFLHSIFAKEYYSKNKDVLQEFLKKTSRNGEIEHSDFDKLSLLTWKTARDEQALSYACKNIKTKYRKRAEEIAWVLKTSYISECVSVLKDFTYAAS